MATKTKHTGRSQTPTVPKSTSTPNPRATSPLRYVIFIENSIKKINSNSFTV